MDRPDHDDRARARDPGYDQADTDPHGTPPRTAGGTAAQRSLARGPAALAAWLAVTEPVLAQVRRPLAVLAVLVGFGITFGLGIVNAVVYLRDPSVILDGQDWDSTETIMAIVKDLGISVAGVAAAVAAVRLLARQQLLRIAPTGWRAERRAAAAWVGLYGVAQLVNSMLPTRGYPYPSAAGRDWFQLSSAITAGPTEELVVLAAPVVLLRAARLPWAVVIVIAAAMRLSFHIYYGWATLGLMVWAVGLVIVYAHTRAVLGLIVMHSWFDVSGTVAYYWSRPAGLALISAAAAFFVVTSVAWVYSTMQARHASAGSAA